ncbi:B3 domain-containing transcription factor VRN1-like [Rosa rugosa]|uniref:B3 domain-containing transcription factor VRN1-like n=1 Tax=Rosa rugosa TaxID=74645 RepID=UPI002B416A51|nr:B3 domain-containing transcription factor VRN1-like [Rosa rugosa]
MRGVMKVPNKFVMKYGKDLLNSVYLKLPSGSEWEVELTRCRDKIWFEKGWPEFSMFCSLDYGSFLVFRYEGNSHFHVCIFDMSATEIDYPITMPKIEEVVEDDDLSIEILEDFQPSPKARKQSPLPRPPYKKMRTSLSSNANMNFDRENTAKRHLIKQPDSNITLQKANAFKSDKPSFEIVMQPSSIHYHMMSLPNEFSKRYLMKLPAGIAILRVSDGRTWSVKFKYDHANSRARLLKGWSPFVRDNNLKVGDVCVFTLINCIELLFEVAFFPTEKSTNFPSSTGKTVHL